MLPQASPLEPDLASALAALHAGTIAPACFFSSHLPTVRRLSHRACVQVGVTAHEDIEDVAQETCARLVDTSTRRFRGGRAASFIVGVAKNAAGAATRRRRSQLLAAASASGLLWGAGGRGVSASTSIEAAVLANEVLDQLGSEAVQLVLLTYTLGATTREVATLFARSPAWVCRRLKMARSRVASPSVA